MLVYGKLPEARLFYANLKPTGLKNIYIFMPDHNMTQKPAVSTDGIVPLAGDITAIVFTGI